MPQRQDPDKAELEDEFGDILFSLINYARYKGIDPETSLEKVNQKFKRRFEYIESHAPKAIDRHDIRRNGCTCGMRPKAKEEVKK